MASIDLYSFVSVANHPAATLPPFTKMYRPSTLTVITQILMQIQI